VRRVLVFACGFAVLAMTTASGGSAGEAGEGGQGGRLVDVARRVENLFDRVEASVCATCLFQGSAGADRDFGEQGDVAAATASVDIGLETQLAETWSASVCIEAGSGGGLDADLPFLVGVNDDADDDENVRLAEVWIRKTWEPIEGHVLTGWAGKVDLTCEFDTNEVANDETSQFSGSGFVNNPAFYAPESDFGVILAYACGEVFALKVGCCDSDQVADRGGRFYDDLFFVGEMSVSVSPFGRSGNYRAFVWYEDAKLPGLDPGTGVDSPEAGFGLSVDQVVLDGVKVFARFGAADSDYYAVDRWASGGLELAGSVWGRDKDAAGLAYGVALLADDHEDLLRQEGGDPGDEHHWELYYRLKMNERMEFSPHLQIVGNPGGEDDNDTVAIFGARLQISF